MHQFYDYLHQNWKADHKNALKQYNQAAVAVIKPNRYLAFFGTPCRHDICPRFYTARFSGYTAKVRNLRHFSRELTS